MADQGAVGVDHALGVAGGAGRVHDHHAVGGRDGVLRGPQHGVVDRRREAVEVEDGLPEHGHGLDGGEGLDVVVRAVGPGAEQEPDVGVAEQRPQLGSGREGAEGNAHGADAGCRQPGDDEGAAVGVEDPDVRALADAGGEQAPGEQCGAAIGLRVGEDVLVAHQQHRVRPLGDPLPEQRRDGERQPVAGVDDRGRHGPVLRGDTSGSDAGSPTTARISASHSSSPPAPRSRPVDVIRWSSTALVSSNPSSVSRGVGRR